MRIVPTLLPLAAAALLFPGTAPCNSTTPTNAPSAQWVSAPPRQPKIREQQKAILALGTQPGAKADRKLLAQFEKYRTGDLPPALWLELFEAAARRTNPKLRALLTGREQTLAASHDPLSRFRECLEGGDAEAGREIFMKKVQAGCVRCHRVSGEGGEIGPNLTALHQATDRVYILESIIVPNAVIAPGFDNVLLTLKSGELVSGIRSFESDEDMTITSVVDGKQRKLKIAEIAERVPLPSAMPPSFGLILSKRDIRDLVEFIATAK